MNLSLIVLLLISLGIFVFAIFAKRPEDKFLLFIAFLLFLSWPIFGYLYPEAGVPLSISSNNSYSPFDNGIIFQKYWESERDGQYLFSVIKITRTEKDTLDEIFSSDIKNLPVKEIKDYFVVFDNNFYSITKEQKDEIIKLDLDEERIKKYLNWWK